MKGFKGHESNLLLALDISVTGRIQGVGFRPFLYRLAKEHSLTGWVKNCTEGVRVHIEGYQPNISRYLGDISTKAPNAARVSSVESTSSKMEFLSTFSIVPSTANPESPVISEITPDIAVCEDCLSDMNNKGDRKNYPFTNCTNCGPRFTIIKALPYDREKTTMKPFKMCESCMVEYKNILDRRFHAQPNSCLRCGPVYTFHEGNPGINTKTTYTDITLIIERTARIIADGGICAIKGLGGYHLACDPFNRKAVERLRTLKKRGGKPFAVMFSSLDELKKHAEISKKEGELLTSSMAPIVLLKLRPKSSIAAGVNSGLDKLGAFLPYTPFYHLLFSLTNLKAVVITSGNIGGEPIIKDDEQALNTFLTLTDCVLTYNREIHNRCDDSVGQVTGDTFRIIRRSRGWIPESLPIGRLAEGIFAAGAELKTCFAIGKDTRAILSQHIGDLKNPEVFGVYRDTMEQFRELFQFTPSLVIHDLHPDYQSTRAAKSLGLPSMAVQHHHAHIASCLAENELDEEVIGFSFDGTGLGEDGNIWGGEVLICSLGSYERKYNLSYLPLPGGDAAVKEPWRTAVSALYGTFGPDFLSLSLPFLKEVKKTKLDMIFKMLEGKINTPLSSSMGRLFDGVSVLLGLCFNSGFDSEGPMRLESTAWRCPEPLKQGYYPLPIGESINTAPLFKGITEDLLRGLGKEVIAARFHNSIIQMTCNAAEIIRNQRGINICALSGGVFMNGYLLEGCKNGLEKKGFTVLTHSKIPSNDGGIALGQIAIGAKTRELGGISCV